MTVADGADTQVELETNWAGSHSDNTHDLETVWYCIVMRPSELLLQYGSLVFQGLNKEHKRQW